MTNYFMQNNEMEKKKLINKQGKKNKTSKRSTQQKIPKLNKKLSKKMQANSG